MKKIKFSPYLILGALALLAAGFLIGRFAAGSRPAEASHAGHSTETEAAAEPAVWTCSMHPQIRKPEPGKCPICGMDLIPLEDNIADENPLEVRMSPTAMQLANVETAVVGFGSPAREIRMSGRVAADERRIFSQATHLDGRVEELSVNFTGEPVRKGQKLASIYSPGLAIAQEELFFARKMKDVQPDLLPAAREKLKNWKLTDKQIDDILAAGKVQERFPILADVSGIVLNKRVNLGDYVMRGMPLYEIVDLSGVWVLFDVYENDMPWARVGSKVSFTVQSLPGETFTGRVAFIDPAINPATRVATARVEVPNPGGRLKPEMFASGLIRTQLAGRGESLLVPKSAVMWTGERSAVYVKKTTDRGVSFRMQEVGLGPLAGDNFVVKDGLQAGDEVAVNGTFSIDAAAQLAGKPSMMNPEGGAAAAAAHQHGKAAAEAVKVSKPARQAVQQLFSLYFPLKDALVEGRPTEAKKLAAELKKAFENTSMGLFTGPAHERWMAHSSSAAAALAGMAAAANIEEARTQFKPLSGHMAALARSFGPFEKTIYVQHCPMADNNAGADWLSLDQQIRNPYFGDKMLKCGSVTDTIR